MRAIGRCGSGGLVGLLAARCQILVVGLVHGLTDPVRHARSWDGEADVTESLKQFGRDVVRTVFVAHDSQMATLSSETMRPSGSDSPKKASRRSRTRWAWLEGWPIQMGVPSTKMLASRICRRISGHSSPPPSSEVTLGRTLRSDTHGGAR
jgi:hypothetical protein